MFSDLENDGEIRREVLGNSQMRGVSASELDDHEELDIKIDFHYIPGGTATDIIELLKHRIALADKDVRYILSLYQNDIRSFGEDGTSNEFMENSVQFQLNQISELLEEVNTAKGLLHKVAIAEEHYVPELKNYHWKIHSLNLLIWEWNVNQGLKSLKLWKAVMKTATTKAAKEASPTGLKVVDSYWKEYVERGLPGYHLKEGRPKQQVSKFLRHYFSDELNWNSD